MNYVSTRGGVPPIDFADAVLMGLADDGGLIVPESIPDAAGQLQRWRGLDYRSLAFEVMRLFVADVAADDLRGIIDRSYGAAFEGGVTTTVKVGHIHVLELWHGPTLAFKDVALQFLGNLFEYILARRGGRLNILGATSGDTGSAAICGVRGRRGIHIFMMHPRGRISPIQERQMTSVPDDNVHNLAIAGSFDDCQRIMKDLAGELDFKRRYALGAVNSVNWARVLAQIVYYFRAVFDVQAATGAEAVRVSVPTGNFGDVLAGYYALRMGLPIRQLILATNENDILARFFNSGVYSIGKDVVQTLSPSMDIQVASNFERYLYYKVDCDPARLRALMEQFRQTGSLRIPLGAEGVVDPAFASASAGEAQVLETIGRYYREHDYLLDPHTAVGVAVAERLAMPGAGGTGRDSKRDASRLETSIPQVSAKEPREPVVCLATAHPAKFPEAIRLATGKDIARHPRIDALMHLPTRCQVLPCDKEAVREFIIRTIG